MYVSFEMYPSEIREKILSNVYKICEKRGRSKVWECFGPIKDENDVELQNFIACRVCNNVYKYNRQYLSNLNKHKCYTLFKNGNELIEPKPDAKKACTSVLTEWVLEDFRPYSLLEDNGLKAYTKLMLLLGNRFGANLNLESLLPHPTTIQRNVENTYSTQFAKLKSEILAVREIGYALTCGLWTDNFSKISNLALTVHFFMDGEYKSKLLKVKVIKGIPNTDQDILMTINEILLDFECTLSKKIILVAEASNPIFKTISDANYLPCMSELLVDALFKSMNKVPEIMEIRKACTDLITYLTKRGHEDLFADLMDDSYQNPWIAMYKTLDFIEKNWTKIETTLRDLNEKALILSISINQLKALTNFLQPFEEAIESLESDSYATLHLVVVYLHELKKTCHADEEFQNAEFIEQLKENLLTDLEQIETEGVTILHKLALFLYPPTNKLLQFNDKEKQMIEDECIRHMENYKHIVQQPITKSEPEDPIDPTTSKRRKLFSDFVEPETNKDTNSYYADEIQLYKTTRVVNHANFDVFNWWQTQKGSFPFLSKLSCAVLSTPATCAPSKHILFKGKYLNRTKLDKILFVNSNAKMDELEMNTSILEY